MSSHKLSLTYFNGRGRAELSRLILAETKTEYKDTRIDSANWPTLKSTTPYGQLPVLKVGDVMIAESQAIARFLANKTGLVGADALETARVDSLVESVLDFGTKYGEASRAKEEKEKKVEEFFADTGSKLCTIWENQLKSSGGDYFFGKKVTYADLSIFNMLSNATATNDKFIEQYPNLKKFLHSVAERPNIAAYLKSRPVTPF